MLFICYVVNEIEMECWFVQLLMMYWVEGLIVNVFGVEEVVLCLLWGGGIFVVQVDCMVEGFDVDLVGFDNCDVIRLGVQYLLDYGFDFIQFIVQLFEQVSLWWECEFVF